MEDCAGDAGARPPRPRAPTVCASAAATADPFAAPERLTVAEAFERFAGIDLLATLDAAGGADRDALAAARRARRHPASPTTTPGPTCSAACWSSGSSRSSASAGRRCSYEYPVAEAALARPKPGDPRVAERFELYACGVELANGFGELTDPAEQRRRFEAEMAEKERLYGERYPIDEDFLAALAHMPPASGVALGFDRLVMLATGAPRIEQVLWAPVPPACPRRQRGPADTLTRRCLRSSPARWPMT